MFLSDYIRTTKKLSSRSTLNEEDLGTQGRSAGGPGSFESASSVLRATCNF